MSPNLRRWKNVTLWLGLGALISPLGFNCHSQTDQSAAISRAGQAQPDDADQIVRALASVDADGAPQGESKVRIGNQVGIATSGSSKTTALVARGTSLLALYDNTCRGKPSALRFEAEEVIVKEDKSVSTLEAEANSDDCLVRVDENHVRQMIAPISDDVRASFQAEADTVTALATTNDARVAEARHITFSKVLSAWDWFYSGSGITTDVIVAVVDTGILFTHPDLADNMWKNEAGNYGYDFINNDNNPTDDNGHGTHVSGIVGARSGNAIGVTGVMGTRVKLMGVKVLNAAGSGSDVAIVNGIRYAADQGAHVINMSLGGQFVSTTIRDAMVYAAGKGVVIVVAAGNDNTLINAGANFYAPAGYSKDIPGSISVGSVDAVTGAQSSFSNYSTTYVWIAAAGSNGILSTYTGNTYTALQGTSMASPVVAGAAALVVGAFRSKSITYTPAEVVTLLTESARPVAGLTTTIRNGATLDVERLAKLFYSRYVMAGNGGTEVQ